MHINICRHHGLPFLDGGFCKECKKDLDKSSKKIKDIFSRVDFDKVFQEKK
jgi:hypothetical protein